MEEIMSKSEISKEYMNTLLFENQKAFWDERGNGARFRLTTVGREFFNEKILPRLEGDTLEDLVRSIDAILQEEGITDEGDIQVEDKLLRIKFKSCIHRDVAERFARMDLPPCYCLPANICALAIDSKLDMDAEIADIKVEKDFCEALIVIFDRYERQL